MTGDRPVTDDRFEPLLVGAIEEIARRKWHGAERIKRLKSVVGDAGKRRKAGLLRRGRSRIRMPGKR
jgi:hypothetical protein